MSRLHQVPEQVLGTPSHTLRVLSTTLHWRGLYTRARTGEKQVNCPIVLHRSQPGPRAQTDLRAWKTLRQSPAAPGEAPSFYWQPVHRGEPDGPPRMLGCGSAPLTKAAGVPGWAAPQSTAGATEEPRPLPCASLQGPPAALLPPTSGDLCPASLSTPRPLLPPSFLLTLRDLLQRSQYLSTD